MGKYTKGALGACQYSGRNQDGIIRFNLICQEVKEDREKIPWQKSITKLIVLKMLLPRNQSRKGRETNSYVDDMSDLF